MMGAKPPKIIRLPSKGISANISFMRGSSCIFLLAASRTAFEGYSIHANTTVSLGGEIQGAFAVSGWSGDCAGSTLSTSVSMTGANAQKTCTLNLVPIVNLTVNKTGSTGTGTGTTNFGGGTSNYGTGTTGFGGDRG